MFDRIKNLKLVKQLKENVSPKLRWLTFSNMNKLDKSTTDYLENISGVDNLKALSDEQELEAMVRAQLKEEFPTTSRKNSFKLQIILILNNKYLIRLQQIKKSNITLDITFFMSISDLNSGLNYK